jgi:hypothetical protein
MRKRLIAIVVTVLVATACSHSTKATHSPPTTPTSVSGTTTTTTVRDATVTSEDQLLSAIRTQGLTPERAKELYALDVGPLPGVDVTGVTPLRGFDASTAEVAIFLEWDGLTTAQQEAVRTVFDPAPPKASAAGGPVHYVLTDSVTSYFQQLADQANAAESAATGTPPVAVKVTVVDEVPENPFEDASTSLWQRFQNGSFAPWPDGTCHTQVWAPQFNGMDPQSEAAIIAHEVWHCYQYRQEGTGENWQTVSPWITEGEANWVMDELHPDAPIDNYWWKVYGLEPSVTYTDESYSAIGVYGHEGDVAGDQATVWPKLLPMVSADVGHHDVAALNLLIGGTSQHYFESWGPSYYQEAKPDWHMVGPAKPPSSGPAGANIVVNNDSTQAVGTGPTYEAQLRDITGDADILVIRLASGYGEVHDGDYSVNQALSTTAPLALCQKPGGCKCPDGSAGASEHTIPSTGIVTLGLDGGDTGLAADAHGVPLDKYCRQPDPPGLPPAPTPSPGGGGESGGSGTTPPPGGQSTGDPHLLTFDGRAYDMQAAGEFTLVKSTADDFVIQTRTVPLPGAKPVAVNQAVATTLGGHRVTFTLDNGTTDARVDGTIDNEGLAAVGPGEVERLGTEVGAGYTVTWADGTVLQVDPMGLSGLDVTVRPAADRAGKLVGLLGGDSGQSGAPLLAADGSSLGDAPTPGTIDGQYADSWRITQAQSLFDYGPGQSTATFTDTTFPPTHIDAATAPGADQARQECEADGITDQYLLADCVVDASQVHDQSVLTHYAQAQVVQTVQYNFAHHLPAFTPPTAATSGGQPGEPGTTTTISLAGVLIDSGRVNDPAETQTFTFPENAGDIIWIGDPGCDNHSLTFALIDPQGQTLNQSDITGGNEICQTRFDLASSGAYRLVANADHKYAGNYSIPIRHVRPDLVRDLAFGQSASGDIDETAAHDVYVIQLHAGDHLDLQACNVPEVSAYLESTHDIPATDGVTARKDIIGIACGTNDLAAQLTDTYRLTINTDDQGPFTYHFVLQKQ